MYLWGKGWKNPYDEKKNLYQMLVRIKVKFH